MLRLLLSYFRRQMLAEQSRAKLAEIKAKDIYPYKEPPKTKVEVAEREVFDILASKLVESPKPLLGGSPDSQALLLNLLKDSLEKGPENVICIIQEVVKLPDDELQSLKELVEQHSLSTVIKIAREVADRMAFLEELQFLVLDKDISKQVLERQHLHKILEGELWIFGDGYELGHSDKSMRRVLEKHVSILGRDALNLFEDDAKQEEFNKRPDIFLYRQKPEVDEKLQHLVIELKRPDLKLTSDELSQIKKYARMVSEDNGFDKSKTNWKFVLVGADYNEDVKLEVTQKDRPKGCAVQQDTYSVYVYKWSELLHALKWKYSFIKSKLDDFERSPEQLKFITEKYGHLFDGKITDATPAPKKKPVKKKEREDDTPFEQEYTRPREEDPPHGTSRIRWIPTSVLLSPSPRAPRASFGTLSAWKRSPSTS